jgi:hypothetical protein
MNRTDWFSLLQAVALAVVAWFTARNHNKLSTVADKTDQTHAMVATTSENVAEIKKEVVI